MRDPITLTRALAWVAFFAASVYGHVALKIAADRYAGFWAQATSAWALSAFVAWTASSVLWMYVLQSESLLSASTISALRYVLLVGAAVFFFGDGLDTRSALGCALVALGVSLVAR